MSASISPYPAINDHHHQHHHHIALNISSLSPLQEDDAGVNMDNQHEASCCVTVKCCRIALVIFGISSGVMGGAAFISGHFSGNIELKDTGLGLMFAAALAGTGICIYDTCRCCCR